MWLLLLIIVLPLLSYLWLIRPYKYWTRCGVPQGRPKPIFGNFWTVMFKKFTFADIIQENYNMMPEARYFGIYNFSLPALLLRDPDLIKQITVKDFDHFVDHTPVFPEDVDPLWAKNLFALTGQKWRDMRSTLSPAFTSSKMKYMFTLISQTSEQLSDYFLNQDQKCVSIDIKDTFTRYTNDVIGNVAFGIECNSLKERKNEFYLMGKEATDLTSSYWKSIKFLLHLLFPKLSKFTGVTLFSAKVTEFFHSLIKNNIRSREKHNIIRPDMINLLMEARKSGSMNDESTSQKDESFASVEESEIFKTQKRQKVTITDQDITAQALLFFFAGFETVSSQITFAAYELAINPQIQEKLTQEIDETLEACKGKISYEALLNMKYMDMVISETLRKWPATLAVDRVCTKPYTIEPKTPQEVKLVLKPKDVIFLPIFGLHRDPQYFPEPERFNPERFSNENKAKIKPFAYIPFGAGPRNCLGSRFALLEMKLLIFNLLKNFKIVPVEKTEIPLKLSNRSFTLAPHDKLWLGLQRRAAT